MRQLVEAGLVAVDLANTWDEYLVVPERLPDLEALRRFCAGLGEEPPVREGDLAAVRGVRTTLRAVLDAEPPERTRALARWADELPARAAVEEVGSVPALSLRPAEDAGLADRLAVRAIRELLDIAAAGEWRRLRTCTAASCRDVFIDRSRPGQRRFCSTRCANRAHAAASRDRRRT